MTLKHFTVIHCERRTISNKSYLKNLKNEGLVPCVLYRISINKNSEIENDVLTMKSADIQKLLQDPSILTRIFELQINEEKINVIIKDIQYDPLTDKAIHVDFMEINKETVVTTIVPVRVVNKDKCDAIKKGADIFILNYNIRVKGLIVNMPNSIDIDIQDAKIGDIIYATNDILPQGCKFLYNLPLLKVAGKRTVEVKEEKTEAAATPAAATAATSAEKGKK